MQEMRRLIREGKNHILFATIIFAIGAWIGYVFSHAFEAIIMDMLEQLLAIRELLEGKSVLSMAWFIFQNNAQAALIMVGMGTVLFFVPLFSLFANGLALGYVLNISAVTGLSPLAMFVYGILPHGILELPAILFAGGIGIFLGLRFLHWLFGRGQFFAHLFGNQRESVGEFWREKGLPIFTRRLKGVLQLAVMLILTLLLAAMIESFITPILIELYVPMPN